MKMSKSSDLKNKITLLVLGRSGSGKGTQSRILVEHLGKENVSHLETGRFLRELLKTHDNPSTQIARRVIGSGKLFPSWFSAFTWLKEILEKGAGGKHLVFDGCPRRVWEAKLIDEVIKWHGRKPPLCIFIDLDTFDATKRLLLRGRSDDTSASIRNRMEFFTRHVLPAVQYYKKEKRLIIVDGKSSSDDVAKSIQKKLRTRFGARWPRKN